MNMATKNKEQIRLDGRNVRVHDERNKQAIAQSLKELGAGRSILIDAENVVIGGNGVYQEALELGLPVKVIESDGSELIAIKRTDLKTNDAKRKALAIADNRTNDLSFFDDEKVAELLAECEGLTLSSGFTGEEIEKLNQLSGVLNDLEQNSFANSIKALAEVFSITFVFPKASGNVVTEYIRQIGKEKLTAHLIDYCRKAVS